MERKAAPKNHEHKHFYLRHTVPVMVWLAALTSVVWLFHERAARFEIVGIARGQIFQVSPTSTGRIREIPVDVYDTVRTGQTLAVVDTILDNEQGEEARLRADLASVTAEIEHLAAQLIPTQEKIKAEAVNLQNSRAGDLRRFTTDVENVHLRILGLQATMAADQFSLNGLTTKAKMLGELVAEEAIAPYQQEEISIQRNALATKIEENEKLLKQARVDEGAAQGRLDQFLQQQVACPSEDHALEVIRKGIKVQEERMNGLLDQIKALKSRETVELKSPIDGMVIPISVRETDAAHQRPGEQVLRRTGEVVRAGDAILAVAQTAPTEIVAYVNEQQLGLLKEKTPVELVKTTTPAQITRSQVQRIGPTMELMPQRLWRSPNIPQWGRPVLIDIPPGFALIPGEVVGIRGV
jgi:multidrug resistance efflux pump